MHVNKTNNEKMLCKARFKENNQPCILYHSSLTAIKHELNTGIMQI